MTKTILITGGSSGIGRATATHFHARRWNVVATMRNPEGEEELIRLDRVLVTRLDVQAFASIQAAVDAGISEFGRIDALMNSAGYGAYGPLEATSLDKVRRQFDVNVLGVLATTKATREPVRPIEVTTTVLPSPIGAYEQFLGARMRRNIKHRVSCTAADALRPFLTSDDSLWRMFESTLRHRLADLDSSAPISERVSAARPGPAPCLIGEAGDDRTCLACRRSSPAGPRRTRETPDLSSHRRAPTWPTRRNGPGGTDRNPPPRRSCRARPWGPGASTARPTADRPSRSRRRRSRRRTESESGSSGAVSRGLGGPTPIRAELPECSRPDVALALLRATDAPAAGEGRHGAPFARSRRMSQRTYKRNGGLRGDMSIKTCHLRARQYADPNALGGASAPRVPLRGASA
ncbi:short chain dehydrogenase [Nannocystis exedens]|uniref:Short chain dehydrogenase n=1 Tax=Nannocystis exedens TaxID=54 RepID=A0A1I1XFN4_9BACT|nr:short-chain dehydrogenase/reductase [Nannocystis exedens]SFE06167.1 short chain dehydrogenase [Nannocystis exedens]